MGHTASTTLEEAPSDNQQDESFAFYVDDANMIQGTKTIDVWYYYKLKDQNVLDKFQGLHTKKHCPRL